MKITSLARALRPLVFAFSFCTGSSLLTACPGIEPTPGEGEGEGEGEDGCPANQIRCGDVCVDPLTDNFHCGAVGDCVGEDEGKVCGEGLLCNGAAECAPSCAAPFTACDGACADLDQDEANCGACGTACAAGESCTDATCCTTGLLGCDGTCVNATTDEANCGGCGNACPTGASCTDAACACPDAAIVCDGACIDVVRDEANCGECGVVCGEDQQCSAGECVDDGVEICEGFLISEDDDGLINCQDDDCASQCTGGVAVTGAACATNGECASDVADPFCLREDFFGFFDGACSEFCDPLGEPCSGDALCAPFAIGAPPQTGLCFDSCNADVDCRPNFRCEDAFGFGQLACLPIDTCGDGVPGFRNEVCDGDALRGQTCASFGLSDNGGLACDAQCQLDFTGCVSVCGDGLVDPNTEACDGDVACADIGLAGDAPVVCNEACTALDSSGCVTPSCGDNVINGGETCDGVDLGGFACVNFGFVGGALACDVGCVSFDFSGCDAICGDGVATPGEDCDDGGVLPGDGCDELCQLELDEEEINDDPATANAFDANFTGQINPNDDRDCMEVTADAGLFIVADMVGVVNGNIGGCGSDPVLFLFDVDGFTPLQSNDDFNGLCSHIQLEVPAAGTYFLCVQAFALGSSFTYRIDTQVTDFPCSFDTCPIEGGGDLCTDLQTDPSNCGACGTQCLPGELCNGECTCFGDICSGADGDVCIDTAFNLEHCGGCNNACDAGEECSNGVCQCPVFAPEQCVNAGVTFCTDLSFDEDNCGACGETCGPGQECFGSECRCPVDATDICIDANGVTSCTDLDTDPNNCGDCDVQCPLGRQVCDGGTCACPASLSDVCPSANGDVCTNVDTDPLNCGACGDPCVDGEGCSNGTCVPVVTFTGVQVDVPVANIAGWSECFSESYASFGPTLDEILALCTGGNLMMACRRVDEPDNLQVLAHAPRADVLFVTGNAGSGGNTPHNANGVAWYFDRNFSWGFAPEGAPLFLSSCDIPEGFGNNEALDRRLCWHTQGDTLNEGFRCGADTSFGFEFERVIYQF